jgi:hypothetical protein
MEMFDEVRTYLTDNEQLIEIVDRRQAELDWSEAQMCYANCCARQECTDVCDPHFPDVRKQTEQANKRLWALFSEGWGPDETHLFPAWWAYKGRLLHHHRWEA